VLLEQVHRIKEWPSAAGLRFRRESPRGELFSWRYQHKPRKSPENETIDRIRLLKQVYLHEIYNMTLIAATLNYKRPIIISDCLVTAEGVKNPPPIPLLPPDYVKYISKGKSTLPIGLKQKMYIVNKNICVVFASDDADEIRTFLPIFKEYFPEGSIITNARIHQFLQKYNLQEQYSKSSFLIFYFNRASETSIEVNQFYLPGKSNEVNPDLFNVDSGLWNIFDEAIFEKTWAHAMGAEKFLNMINQPVLAESSLPKEDMGRAIQMNGILLAKLLALQATANGFYSIKDDWGGAFEMSFFNGKEFEKMNDYAFMIFHSQFDDEGDIGIPRPIFVLYHQYIKNVLFIIEISGRFESTEDDDYVTFLSGIGAYRIRIFAVESVEAEDHGKPVRFPTDLSFSTEVVGVGYSLITRENAMFNPAFFTLGGDAKIVYRKDKNVKITIRKQITDRIRELSKQKYPLL
jgi:hypothetical protein